MLSCINLIYPTEKSPHGSHPCWEVGCGGEVMNCGPVIFSKRGMEKIYLVPKIQVYFWNKQKRIRSCCVPGPCQVLCQGWLCPYPFLSAIPRLHSDISRDWMFEHLLSYHTILHIATSGYFLLVWQLDWAGSVLNYTPAPFLHSINSKVAVILPVYQWRYCSISELSGISELESWMLLPCPWASKTGSFFLLSSLSLWGIVWRTLPNILPAIDP